MPPDLKGRQFFAIKGQQSWRADADTPLAESHSSVGEEYKAFTSEPEYWENQSAGGVNVARTDEGVRSRGDGQTRGIGVVAR